VFGSPPAGGNPADQLLDDRRNRASSYRIMLDAERVLQDENERRKYLALYSNDQKGYLAAGGRKEDEQRDRDVLNAIRTAAGGTAANAPSFYPPEAQVQTLLAQGRFSPVDLAQLGFPDSIIQQRLKTASNDERDQLSKYYKMTDQDPRKVDPQITKWEDKLLTGGSLVSTIADNHKDANQVLQVIEQMGRQDYQRLASPVSGPEFKKELADAINKYIDDPQARQRALDLINAKAAAPTFEASLDVRRSILDVGTDKNALLNGVLNLRSDEQQRYLTDQAFRAQVDKLVGDRLDGVQKLVAQEMLGKLQQLGRLPTKDQLDPEYRVFYDDVTGASAWQKEQDIEAALQDKGLRDRLKKDNLLHPGQFDPTLTPHSQVKDTADRLFAEEINSTLGQLEDHARNFRSFDGLLQVLLENGKLAESQKIDLGLPKQQLIADLAGMKPEDRESFEQYAQLNAEQIKIVEQVAAGNGQLTLADRLRSFVVGDVTKYGDYAADLRRLSPQQLQQLKNEYARKYGSDLDDDFLNKVDQKDYVQYKDLLSPVQPDGKQDYFDDLGKLLRSENGRGSIGAQQNAERALQLYAEQLQKAELNGKPLDAATQQELNKYFGQALQDYKDSKEALARQLISLGQDALIFGSGLLAIAASGGTLSPAVLAAIAVAGASLDAAGRIAVLKVIEGNDFDGSAANIFKEAGIGFVNGALIFGPIAAPELIARISARATATVLTDVAGQAGLSEATTRALQPEIDNVVASAVRSGRPIVQSDLDPVLDAAVRSGQITEEQAAALRPRIVADANAAAEAEKVAAAPDLIQRAARPEAPKSPESAWTLPNRQQVDPVTRQVLESRGLTPDDYVYRTLDPKYLNADGTISGNPRSVAQTADPYNLTTYDYGGGISFTRRTVGEASSLPPGLNVAALDPGIYGQSGNVTVAIKISDLLQANGKVYYDVGGAAQGLGLYYFTFDGSVPYTLVR
jgi:hypothetical protein